MVNKKLLLLSVGLLFFGLQADKPIEQKLFVQNSTPYPINFHYNYTNETSGRGGGGILYEIEPNGFSSIDRGICDNSQLSVQVFINMGTGMRQVIDERFNAEDPAALTVSMLTDQNGRKGFHLTTNAYRS